MIRAGWILLCLTAALVAGCPQPTNVVGKSPPSPVAGVDAIELHTLPVALNWDERPGADGLEARVLFYQRKQPLPVTVKGTVEFLVFEGQLGMAEVREKEPFFAWAFSGEQLKSYAARSVAGWGYAFRLPWGQKAPRTNVVTLTVRYQPPRGAATYAQPVVVAIKQT